MSHRLCSGSLPVRPLLLLPPPLSSIASAYLGTPTSLASQYGILTTRRGPVLVVIDNARRLTSLLTLISHDSKDLAVRTSECKELGKWWFPQGQDS